MQSITLELSDEQVEQIKEFCASPINVETVSGGNAALGYLFEFIGGYLGGKALDSIANADGNISGRQIGGEYYAP